MKKLHFIYTPTTGVGLHGGYRGDNWFRGRVEIFKKYTLKSLLNQKNKDFIHWFSFRDEEQYSQIVDDLRKYLTSIKYPFVFTFDGLMYHDDKFTNFTFKTCLRNLLMMVWDCWRYKQLSNPFRILRYAFENKNKTLLSRLTWSLGDLKRFWKGEPWIYLTRIDSDDMFHRDAVELIQEVEPKEKRAITIQNGYVLNHTTGQLADWNPPTNPPFHTIIFPADSFFNVKLHKEYYGKYRSHESIPHVFECIQIPDKNYCYAIHGNNISTYWNTDKLFMVSASNKTNISTRWHLNKLRVWWLKRKNPQLKTIREVHPFIGKEYTGEEKNRILKTFGII